ncbi:LysR family transcriptional regulator [Umboniibacter marinipuniceus]|uniref:DNA-binding transcriptional LysR family regulator n=1 Tax=Umboniibacter marinipuniceus TaxID=569599 RepID=A0A3M0A1T9_9GAMM|nr:LysR family transcriptional regulator [Umboniibacter marinipuniceus]RMA78943.1 DNA-binding transcriptional LysR family regulator [Umboniibacter marinipuniceus]
MDTQSLKAFLWVAETGSFSEAAESLHLTQPAVSKRIASLEDQLNVRLFDRINRRVSLTESGRVLLPRAQHILKEVMDARRVLRDMTGEIEGPLKMATSHHVGLHRLPPVLKDFAKSYPKVSPDMAFMDSEKAYEEVLAGRQELAVVTLAPTNNSNLNTHPIWRDDLVFVVGKEHVLAEVGELNIESMSKWPAILPGDVTYTGRIVKHLFESREVPLHVAMSTNYLETIKMLVNVGMGWSVLPRCMSEDLVQFELTDVEISRNLGVIWHKARTLSNAAKAFIGSLSEHRDDGIADIPAIE